ncbi:MAG TPA: glycosyltransferase family 39 protein, partial [Ktedonobacteraceae bacterium]
GFWIQAASAKLLGFSGFSLLLPEALAAIASVALLYLLVARVFGKPAGLCAALVLALTPISVVVARNNTIDSLLILVLLLAVYYVSRAVETGNVYRLLVCAFCIGLGFNIKMLQAYLIVPACGFMYLVGAPIHWRTRLWHLLLAGILLLVISLCWAVVVDLTPATQRPFVSDSGTNSELSLILGYNGLGRVLQIFAPNLQTIHIFGIAIDLTLAPGSAPYIGTPGLLRLFNQGIGNQISWFLPLAVAGLCAASWQTCRHLPLKQAGVALLIWGGWLVTALLYFSFARFFHLYYLTMLAPPLAALVGIGLAILWREYRRAGSFWWGLPLALVCNALGQGIIVQAIIALAISVHSNPSWSQWITPLITGGCLLMACGLVLLYCWSQKRVQTARFLLLMSLLLLLVAPLIWDGFSLESGSGGIWLPQAGPSQPINFGPSSPGQSVISEISQEPVADSNRPHTDPISTQQPESASLPGKQPSSLQTDSPAALVIAGAHWNVLDPKLIRYLQAQQGHTTYLAATETATYASILILAT